MIQWISEYIVIGSLVATTRAITWSGLIAQNKRPSDDLATSFCTATLQECNAGYIRSSARLTTNYVPPSEDQARKLRLSPTVLCPPEPKDTQMPIFWAMIHWLSFDCAVWIRLVLTYTFCWRKLAPIPHCHRDRMGKSWIHFSLPNGHTLAPPGPCNYCYILQLQCWTSKVWLFQHSLIRWLLGVGNWFLGSPCSEDSNARKFQNAQIVIMWSLLVDQISDRPPAPHRGLNKAYEGLRGNFMNHIQNKWYGAYIHINNYVEAVWTIGSSGLDRKQHLLWL